MKSFAWARAMVAATGPDVMLACDESEMKAVWALRLDALRVISRNLDARAEQALHPLGERP